MRELNITSVLDVGCGDLAWARWMDWSGVDYRGVDISAGAIKKNEAMMTEWRRQCAEGGAAEHETGGEELGGGERTRAPCARLPRSMAFAVLDVVRSFPSELCNLPAQDEDDSHKAAASGHADEVEAWERAGRGTAGAWTEDGGCELLVLKEVLIHLTVAEISSALTHLDRAARAAARLAPRSANPPSHPPPHPPAAPSVTRSLLSCALSCARGRPPDTRPPPQSLSPVRRMLPPIAIGRYSVPPLCPRPPVCSRGWRRACRGVAAALRRVTRFGLVCGGSAPRFLLATHDLAVTQNDDRSVTLFPLPGGGWRPVNLLLPPFSLPPPERDFPGRHVAGLTRDLG